MQPLHTQRRDKDCAIAALASLLHLQYEDVYAAALIAEPHWKRTGGLSVRGIVQAAEALGFKLGRVHHRHVDLETMRGLLIVNWNEPKKMGGYGHCVILDEGRILDPRDNPQGIYDADEYLALNGGRVGTLLTIGEAA